MGWNKFLHVKTHWISGCRVEKDVRHDFKISSKWKPILEENIYPNCSLIKLFWIKHMSCTWKSEKVEKTAKLSRRSAYDFLNLNTWVKAVMCKNLCRTSREGSMPGLDSQRCSAPNNAVWKIWRFAALFNPDLENTQKISADFFMNQLCLALWKKLKHRRETPVYC